MSDMERPTEDIREAMHTRRELVAWIEHLESELANAPRAIRADEVTTDHETVQLIGEGSGEWLTVKISRGIGRYWFIKMTTFSSDTYEREIFPDALVCVRPKQGPVMPIEPTGHGYIYISIVLHNGAESIAKRSPNGHWWWESLPSSDPNRTKSGTWDDLLDYYGRTLPLTIVRLGAVDEVES